jgi:hypothetical protein
MPEAVFTVLGSAGVAGIWVICNILGLSFSKNHVDDLKEQISDLKEAVRFAEARADSERRRADAAVEAAQTSNLLLASIRREIPQSGPDKA